MTQKIEIPENILCSKSHEYVIVQNDIATIGITAYAAEQLGDIVYVELPEVGAELSKGEIFGTVESVKAASELYMPISGKIVEINENLTSEPELINENPYELGWIAKISNFNPEDLKNLMDFERYMDFVEE